MDWHISRLIRPSLWTVCHFIRGIFHSAEWILHHFLSVCFVCVRWAAREDMHLRYTLISVSSERRVWGIYGRCPLAADQQGLSPQGPWQVWVCVCVCACKRESVLRIWSCGFLPRPTRASRTQAAVLPPASEIRNPLIQPRHCLVCPHTSVMLGQHRRWQTVHCSCGR